MGKGNLDLALQSLQAALPYEMGSPPLASLYPIYLRGEAYRLSRQNEAATKEYRKILDHPGLVLNFHLHALSFLQLRRARERAGDATGARQNYEEFLHLWTEADSDIPIFKQAKAEYAHPQ